MLPSSCKPQASFLGLEQQRDACRAAGDYRGAALAQQELENAKLHEEIRIKALLQADHDLEFRTLEQEHIAQYAALRTKWGLLMDQQFQQFQLQDEAMQLRHETTRQHFSAACHSEAPKPKCSRQLLDFRVKEENMIKQHQFQNAQKASHNKATIFLCLFLCP